MTDQENLQSPCYTCGHNAKSHALPVNDEMACRQAACTCMAYRGHQVKQNVDMSSTGRHGFAIYTGGVMASWAIDLALARKIVDANSWTEVEIVNVQNGAILPTLLPVQQEDEKKYVYIRWDMDADSWNGTRRMLDVYDTFEAALVAVPDNLKKDFSGREPYGNYVADFAYEAIEKRELK